MRKRILFSVPQFLRNITLLEFTVNLRNINRFPGEEHEQIFFLAYIAIFQQRARSKTCI